MNLLYIDTFFFCISSVWFLLLSRGFSMNHTACVGVVLLYGTLRLECDGIGTLYFILFSRLRVSLSENYSLWWRFWLLL